MDAARASVWGALAIVVVVSVASGPLVGAIALEEPADTRTAPGSGTARATVVSMPAAATLERGEFGSGSYYLRVPDAVVDLRNVTGQPLVTYKLYVRSLGYSHGTTHFLSAADAGRTNVSIESDALAPDRIRRSSYRGELLLRLRTDSGSRTLAERNVTVVVER